MRNTRRWLVLLLTLAMLMNTFGFAAMAAENESPIALTVSPAVEPGSNLQVQVLATQTQTVADGKLVLTYDAAKLTFAGAETGAAWADGKVGSLSVNDKQPGKVILAFANDDAASDGILFTLNFTVVEAGDVVVAIDGSSYISGVDADLAAEASSCPSARFVDLTSISAEGHRAVDYMVAKGYMTGMSKTMFGPHTNLNRAMMVTILYRIAGSPAVEGTPGFTDVPAKSFYTKAVIWANANGITSGVTKQLFAPNRSLTRQELVTFLYRFAKYMGYDVTAAADLSDYTDADTISPFALKAFKWAIAEGIIKGTSKTTLKPAATTTRLQVCLMVYRMIAPKD